MLRVEWVNLGASKPCTSARQNPVDVGETRGSAGAGRVHKVGERVPHDFAAFTLSPGPSSVVAIERKSGEARSGSEGRNKRQVGVLAMQSRPFRGTPGTCDRP